jgi:hypothetical protein
MSMVWPYSDGEPDEYIAFLFDDQPSLGGVIDAPRLRDALANWAYQSPEGQHWSDPAAWERDAVTE